MQQRARPRAHANVFILRRNICHLYDKVGYLEHSIEEHSECGMHLHLLVYPGPFITTLYLYLYLYFGGPYVPEDINQATGTDGSL